MPGVKASDSSGSRGVGVPPDLLRRVEARSLVDTYARRFHTLEAEIESGVMRPVPRLAAGAQSVPVVRYQAPQSVLQYRAKFDKPLRPLPGFRAPILGEAQDLRPAVLPESGLSEAQQQAARVIRSSLRSEGLLATLARALDILGASRFVTNGAAGLRELQDLGVPVDLLGCFFADGPGPRDPRWVVAEVARRSANGMDLTALAPALQATPFRFFPTDSRFRAVSEAGDRDLGLLRLQIGGGYRGGIVHGGSIDVTGQLVAALPDVQVLATVPEEFLENLRWLAERCWPLRPANHLTFIVEPVSPAAWAQDNGKAGFLAGEKPGSGTLATLAPRYASQDELDSRWFPWESFLMDGVRAAGHTVLHSPLLFQGGNLLVVDDPATDQRLLLLAETEVHRNVGLGLTDEQVLKAFRLEFGVDRCVVLPAVSYHLDYDLAVRAHGGRVIAFVNDSDAAVRLVVERGVAVLEHHRALSADAASRVRLQLQRGDFAPVVRELDATLALFLDGRRRYRSDLVQWFASTPTDSPALNFRCFCAARDLLAARVLTGPDTPSDALTRDYHAALRELEAASRAQRDQLVRLGWKVVPVPSMPDLHRSLNYLNLLQDRARLLLPSLGGFYAELDRAAEASFRAELGDSVRIIRIANAEAQAQHGGLHCLASAYPRLQAP